MLFRFDGFNNAYFVSDLIPPDHPGLKDNDLSPKGVLKLATGPSPAAKEFAANPEVDPPFARFARHSGISSGIRAFRKASRQRINSLPFDKSSAFATRRHSWAEN